MVSNRRSFLKKAGGVTAVVAAGPIGLVANGPHQSPPTAEAAIGSGRGFLAGHFALQLEGIAAGFLHGAEGGGAVAEVITEPAVPGQFAQKHLGRLGYEEIKLDVGPGMNASVYDWISDAMTPGADARRDGAILAVDFNFNVVHTREFKNALLSEIAFPASDAASQAPVSLGLTLAPESTSQGAGGGETGNFPKTKAWLANNFRFTLGNLPTSRVIKIDGFTVKQKVKEVAAGQSRVPQKEPATVEIPNLKVTFAAVDLPAWQDFFDDFVLDGKNGQAAELSGRIEYLPPNLQGAIFTVELRHVGIFALTPVPPETEPGTARAVAELYVEEMSFVRGVTPPD